MKETEEETINPSPNRSVLLWIMLITLGGITYYTRFHFVPALQTYSTVLPECPTTIYKYLNYECKDFDIQENPVIAMEIKGVTPDHGFVSLEAVPILDKGKPLATIVMNMAVHTFAVNKDRQILKMFKEEKKRTVQFSALTEDQTEYAPQAVSEITHISNSHYIVVIRLLNNNDLKENHVKDMKMGFVTFNPTFGQYLFYFKCFLFGVAVLSWIIYSLKSSEIPSEFATFEQRCIKYIGFLLMLFVQPFIGYATFERSFTYSLIAVGITATLTSAIIALWLYQIERLSASEETVSSNFKAAVTCFAILHFILVIVTFGFLALEQTGTPIIELQSDQNLAVTLCKYYVFIVVGIGSLWTLIRGYQILRRIKNFDWRDSNAFTFSFYYILCYGIFLITGSLQLLSLRGERVVLLLGITTMYVVLMQIIYAPSSLESEDAQERRKYDNPAVKGAYDDLSMSDMASGTESKDKAKLRVNDVLGKRAQHEEEEEEEEEEIEV